MNNEKHICYICSLKNKTPHDISQITNNIFIGNFTSSRCKTNLTDKNISAILNISGIEVNPYTSNYLFFDINDNPSENIKAIFNQCFEFIDKNVENNKNVLVHCQMGISRSTTIVIYYLMKKNNIKFQDAYDIVKNKRSVANPNFGFVFQLKQEENNYF